jgi:hypothetical protein
MNKHAMNTGRVSTLSRLERRFMWRVNAMLRCLCMSAFLFLSAIAASPAAAEPPGEQKIFETNITHAFDAAQGRMGGEPEVSVNPKNTQNLIMAGDAHKKHATLPLGDSVAICPLGVTFDGGRTWNLQEIPLGRVAGTSEDVCADGFTGADRDGTLYAGGVIFPHSAVTGHVRLVRSTDGGATWGAYVNVIGAETASRFAPGIVLGPSVPFVTDRPFIAVDQSNGTVYVTSRIDSPIPSPPGAGHRFVTASHDKGQTFGTIYTIDSADYPGNDGWIAAAHGVLAASYPASSAPGANCPCTVFETSTDDGATWNRRIVPVPSGQLAADPVHKGRYAVLDVNAILIPTPLPPNQVRIWETDDSGQTWTGPAVLGEPPSQNTRFKTWLQYGPQGFLGVMWRTRTQIIGTVGVFGELNGPYEIWAALSRDGGKSFSAPLKVNQGVAPAYPSDYVGFGDDFSWITLDHNSAHIGWGDARGTDTPADPWPDIWYGRVDLPAFKGGGAD